jgi:hypothetical protein
MQPMRIDIRIGRHRTEVGFFDIRTELPGSVAQRVFEGPLADLKAYAAAKSSPGLRFYARLAPTKSGTDRVRVDVRPLGEPAQVRTFHTAEEARRFIDASRRGHVERVDQEEAPR